MKFINYIQLLPEKQLVQENYQTMFDDFNQRMQQLFTSVYHRKWTQTNLYDVFNNQNQTVEQLRMNVKQLQESIENNLVARITDF